jgi:putative nucleotidyltransferase with HDIG domain
LRQQLVDFIGSDRLELPIMPQLATQIMAMTSDPACDIKKLAEMISRDQAMAGNMLRIANSPLYMGTMKIVTLQQAVTRLGLQVIRTIAVVISCETRAFSVKGWEPEVKQLFRHSLAAALFAQEIARARRWNVEEGFLCGLLHDVGKPVVLQSLIDIFAAAKAPIDKPAILATMDEFHPRVGAALVLKWSLPARIGETILYHHDPSAAPQAAQTAMLTNFADDLAHFAIGPRVVTEAQLRTHPMLKPLNLYQNELDKLLAQREKIAEAVAALS